MLKLYAYANCDSCRRAARWLREAGHAFTEVPIRETPPTPAELRTVLAALDGDLRRLYNTSGRDYRALGLSAQLPTLSVDEALALLSGNGNLIKRPVLLGPGVALAGFQPDAWRAALT
jgi:arsenate reductase